MHNSTTAFWPALVIGMGWILLFGLSVSRLWRGLRGGSIRWGSAEIEKAGDPSRYWRYVGLYSIVPGLTLALLALVVVSGLGASSS